MQMMRLTGVRTREDNVPIYCWIPFLAVTWVSCLNSPP